MRRLSLNRSEPAKKSGQNIPKNRCRTTIPERMVETLAEVPFIGDQVGLHKPRPGPLMGVHRMLVVGSSSNRHLQSEWPLFFLPKRPTSSGQWPVWGMGLNRSGGNWRQDEGFGE